MGLFDIFTGNANSFRALGPNGQPINSIGQSSFQASPGFNAQGVLGSTIGNFSSNYAQQQKYIDMLNQQATGAGPSIAQGILQQGLERNNQAAASLAASNRSINPGLAFKMAMDTQAGNNQNAVQNAALLRSQEMLQGRQQLGQALGQQGAQNLGMFGQAGQQNMGAQGINAQTAGLNAQLQNQGLGINAGAAQQNAQLTGGLWGGLLQGLGSAGAAFAGKSGGGAVMPTFSQSGGDGFPGYTAYGNAGVPSYKFGGSIPGKAKVSGDSKRNDTVPAALSPGEIVIPRSIAQAEDAPEKAAAFVRALRAHHKMAEGGEVPNYGRDVLAKQKDLEKRIAALEKKRARA